MTKNRQACLVLVVAAMVTLVFSAPAWSQESPEGQKLPKLWDDFLYYIKVAQPVAATSWGEAILASGAEPREVYRLASKDMVETQNVLTRGEGLENRPGGKGIKDVVTRIRKMIREGLQVEASNPQEIAKAIDKLDGTLQEYENALEKLKLSGEYALPQLLQKLGAPDTNARLKERIRTVLPRLGRVAVRGLTAALQSDDQNLQEAVAVALRDIGYPHATARLKELAEKEGVLPRVSRAARSAMLICGGDNARSAKVSDLFYELAENYYYRNESLRSDSQYATANVWYWQKGLGLVFKQVPRAIFCDVYAMRMARLALRHDQNSQKAAALWLAANLRREADLPQGAVDPTWAKDAPSAGYYALAAGPRYLLDVLARGLKDGHSPVAVGAIEALARTGGAESLVGQTADGIKPLVKALTFPDRNVRFLAAVSIADALPQKEFEGSQLTVAIISEALRQKGRKTALVAISDDSLNAVVAAVREAGYRVISAPAAGEALAAGRKANGVDLVVLGARPNALDIIPMLRSDPAYAAVPAVVVFRTAQLRRVAETDGRIVLLPQDADGQAITAAAAEAAKLGVGVPLTTQQADKWIIRTAGTVAMLGRSGNKVLDFSRTTGALIEALESDNATVQTAVMEALSVIKAADAQEAIARVGASAEMDEAVRLKALASLSASVRRFGNLMGDADVQAIMTLVTGGDSAQIRDVAAQALGALDLPSEKIKSLIVGVE